MLTILRKKKVAKRILWALAIIIIPAFVLWGVESLSKRKFTAKYIGKIDGKRISLAAFVESRRDVEIGLFLSYFSQPQVLDKLEKDRKLLNRLAWENLIIKVNAKKDKIAASDKEVVSFITTHPLFSRTGVFDDKLYNYFLRNNLGMTARAFEENVRNFIVNAKYKNGIIINVNVTDEELLQSYRNDVEKAAIDYIVVEKDSFKGSVRVPEEEINAFYEKNKTRFRDPEKIVLQYIAFPHKEKGAKEKALADLKDAYENLRKKPRQMETIVKNMNLTLKETPPFAHDDIVPEIGEISDIAAISSKLRPLTDILPFIDENEIGASYIIRLKEKIPPAIKSKEEVSPYIETILKEEKTQELAGKEAEKIYKDAEANKMPLEEVAKKYGFEPRKTALVSRFDYIEGAGESYKIVEEAFKLKKGEISKPLEARKGFVFIEPLEFQFANMEEFEKQKENLKNRLLSLKKMKALEDWLTKAKANCTLNVDLDAI